MAGEGDVLRMIEELAAEEDDLPLEQRRPDLGYGVRREGPGEVGALDLRADVHRHGTYAD